MNNKLYLQELKTLRDEYIEKAEDTLALFYDQKSDIDKLKYLNKCKEYFGISTGLHIAIELYSKL